MGCALARKSNRLWVGTAVIAGLSLIAAPASAGGRGHYGRHHQGRDHASTGDVIAGIMVLGAIAAIASEASSKDRPEYSESDVDLPQSGYRASGMDRATDMCVAEVERGRDHVQDVDSASRSAAGWFVSGSMADGRAWTCRIGADGRNATVEVEDGYHAGLDPTPQQQGVAAGQYNDAYYTRARAALGSVAYVPPAGDEQLAAVTN